MAQTVIGIFESNRQAQDAFDRLVQENFEKSNIDIIIPEKNESRGDVTDDYTLSTRIGNYFTKIFADNNIALKYAAVAQRGVTVTVKTENYNNAEYAASILNECGAVNVDERAAILEDGISRQDRKLNLQEGKTEPNTIAPGSDTHHAGEGYTRMQPGSTVKSRIIELPVSNSELYREEHTWVEHSPRESRPVRVDEKGNVHKE